MSLLFRQFRDLFVSLKLTVTLLALSIALVFWATLAQTDLGIWGVHERFFHSFFVTEKFPGTDVGFPVFPGGYLIGGLLLANLLCAHFTRFRLGWRKAGIWLTHAGLILLLLGELLSGLWQQDYDLMLANGETKNYSENERYNEVAITDVSDPAFDDVVAIPEELIASGDAIQSPKLPFRVVPRTYYPNAALQMRRDVPGAPPSPANQGTGTQVAVTPVPTTSKEDERNVPAAFIELAAPDGSLGTWLVSPDLGMPQHFTYAGREWKISMRSQRRYLPFSLTLLKFSHDIYPGTDIPKNFSSRVRVNTPGGPGREVLIYMNNPMRIAGLTFYQKSFTPDDRATVLQVVSNPSWLMPYISCAMMALGLVLQFSLHLAAFFGRRRRVAAAAPGPEPSLPLFQQLLPVVAVACGLGFLASKVFPPPNPSAFDTQGFGRLPVLTDGRVKPFDTLARSSLLQLQGRQRVAIDDTHSLTPDEWLLDVLFRPEKADGYATFIIDNPDVLGLIGKSDDDLAIHYPDRAHQIMAVLDVPGVPSRRRRFSYREIEPHFSAIEAQAKLADPVDSRLRNPFQRSVLQLYENLSLYRRLEHTLQEPGSADFLGELRRFQDALPAGVAAVRAKEAGQPHSEDEVRAMIELGQRYDQLAQATQVLAIPPSDAAGATAGWKTAGQGVLEAFGTGEVDPGVMAYAGLGYAWRTGQPDKFNTLVGLYGGALARQLSPELRKSNAEFRFNAAEPFYASMLLYIFAFFAAILSWLAWPRSLGRAAYWLVILAWVAATAGIAARMWIEGRPPVTNLYSSALFIGWGAVGLCLLLEGTYRNAIGTVAAGLIGFGTLLIAHHLSLSGDTMEMMRAVLDSNFWLATHVVVVTTGYASTFLAGFLALIYVTLGVATPWLNRNFNRDGAAAGKGETNADALARMVYGIVCFATLFSFVGTVLGGIWADQSWGRFWGWDPKENGALIIVIWNAIILHARWGGMIRQRGLMCLAVFGNIVTSWSWFGVNMLGVGLHSYGFTEAAFQALSIFIASQLLFIAVANLPLDRWRSGPALAA
jgi:ABC-type transport system involved in cytochrome c biogenesis permease subunit